MKKPISVDDLLFMVVDDWAEQIFYKFDGDILTLTYQADERSENGSAVCRFRLLPDMQRMRGIQIGDGNVQVNTF